MTRYLWALGAIVVVLLMAAQAWANEKCAPRNLIVQLLAEQHGEDRVSVAMDTRGVMFETFNNAATGTWTTIATNAQGVACMIGWGTHYEPVAVPAKGDPA